MLTTDPCRQVRYPDSVVEWNANEFVMRFQSLESELKVGGFYLGNYLHEVEKMGFGKESEVDDPMAFLDELHHTLLFDNRPATQILCLKTMVIVYTMYRQKLGVYPFINHLCQALVKLRGVAFRRCESLMCTDVPFSLSLSLLCSDSAGKRCQPRFSC